MRMKANVCTNVSRCLFPLFSSYFVTAMSERSRVRVECAKEEHFEFLVLRSLTLCFGFLLRARVLSLEWQ